MRVLAAVATVCSLLAMANPVWPHGSAGNQVIDERAALDISQAAIGRPVGSYQLRSLEGQTIDTATWRGRPTIVSLIYTSCHHTCPVLTHALINGVSAARDMLGRDSFNVVTVGFDTPNDTPERMAAFAHHQGIDTKRWTMLSGDQAAVDGLTRDLGFLYEPSPKGFDHLAQVTVIDAQGRVYAQVYGDDFRAPAMVEPIKQLVLGGRVDASRPATWLNRIKFICTIYDPTQDRYRYSYAVIVGALIGLCCLTWTGWFMYALWRRPRTAVEPRSP